MKRLVMVTSITVMLLAASDGRAQPPIAVAPANPVTAADSMLEAQTNSVAATLRCPVCQGESIQDSPSTLAQQMKSVVRERLRSGESPEQVKAYFVARYGEWILLEPRWTGLNIALYLLPVVLIIGGLLLVVRLVRKWTKNPQPLEESGR
jgi:cytochrome c-type biogenesis protein CcmH